jgi:hypothetical protein
MRNYEIGNHYRGASERFPDETEITRGEKIEIKNGVKEGREKGEGEYVALRARY